MKKLILLSTTLFLMFNCFAQRNIPQRNNGNTRTFEDYMAKSRKRNTAAWIFVGTGTALTAGGIILVSRGVHQEDNNDYYGNDYGAGKIIGGAVMTVGGVLLACTSIPFFIMAGHYKKKAMRLAFKEEQIQLPTMGKLNTQYYPALTMKVNLGR